MSVVPLAMMTTVAAGLALLSEYTHSDQPSPFTGWLWGLAFGLGLAMFVVIKL